MRFLSDEQAATWCRDRGIPAPGSASGEPDSPRLRFSFAALPVAKLVWLAEALQVGLGPWDQALLWVTQAGVWPSSEPLHLYYRLRASYHDTRLLTEAPGHLFLKHERADLQSFLSVALASGWDFHLLSSADFGRIFVSHDEYAEVASASQLPELQKLLDAAGVRRELA